jgi:hypothetical protein
MLAESIPSTALEGFCCEDELIEPEFDRLGFNPGKTIHKGQEIRQLLVVSCSTSYRSRLCILNSLEKSCKDNSDLIGRREFDDC